MKKVSNQKWIALLLGLSLLLTACSPFVANAQNSEAPAVVLEPVGTAEVSVATAEQSEPVGMEAFQEELLLAIQSRDKVRLEQMMAENFTSGWWRGEMGDLPRANALDELFRDQIGDPAKVGIAATVDLKALMGVDPLGILRPEAGVVDTLLMNGWGKDSEDEAILFVARQPDGSLRWAGTIVILGGFTSPQTGGVQQLIDPLHGFQMYLPLGFEVVRSSSSQISILAPQGSGGEIGRAGIQVEPAGGRTVEQIVEELKQTALMDVADQIPTAFSLDTEMAIVFDGVAAQDMMRVLFVVHEDRFYRMDFYPQDASQPAAYAQMRNVYAVITNTFQFIPLESNVPITLGDANLDVDLQGFINQLQYGLIERNKVALQSMMGNSFSVATERSGGTLITSGDAIQQILNSYIPSEGRLVLDLNHPLIAGLYPEHPFNEVGDELIPVFVSGWGPDGKDEAIFFIARRLDGSLYWQGVRAAAGGFGG